MDNYTLHSKNRYRVIDGKTSIELKLKTPHQLFDERDPAPFRERDLDDDAAKYIVTACREIGSPKDAKLSLYFATLGDFAEQPQTIKNAIRNYFLYEAELKRREMKFIFQQGFVSLLIGLTFLFAITYFTHGLGAERSNDFLISMAKEGLHIIWWVTMWKPVSIFLYEWWPIRAALTLHREIAEMEIEILPLTSAEEGATDRAAERAPVQKLRLPNFKTS